MDVAIDVGSDLSDLSEMGSEDVRGRVPRRKPSERTRVQPSRNTRSRATAALEPGAIVLEDGAMLEGGTLGMSWNFCSFRYSFSMFFYFLSQCGPRLVSI
jgi:hypothetical protein